MIFSIFSCRFITFATFSNEKCETLISPKTNQRTLEQTLFIAMVTAQENHKRSKIMIEWIFNTKMLTHTLQIGNGIEIIIIRINNGTIAKSRNELIFQKLLNFPHQNIKMMTKKSYGTQNTDTFYVIIDDLQCDFGICLRFGLVTEIFKR